MKLKSMYSHQDLTIFKILTSKMGGQEINETVMKTIVEPQIAFKKIR